MSKSEEEQKVEFPEGVEYPDKKEKGKFSDQVMNQMYIDTGIKDLNPKMLLEGLCAEDGTPHGEVKVNISNLLASRNGKTDVDLENYHNCLRLVARFMKARGVEKLTKIGDISPLRTLADSPTLLEDMKVLTEEFGVENIDFDYVISYATSHGVGWSYKPAADLLIKSYLAEYIKLHANEKDNESLKRSIHKYFKNITYDYRFRQLVEDLPNLMKDALDEAKKDIGEGDEAKLNQAANALEADILGRLYNQQQKTLKDDLWILPFSIFIVPALFIVPYLIIKYARRPIGKLDLNKKQVAALSTHKAGKLEQEAIKDDTSYSKMRTLSPVNKNNKLRPILLNLEEVKKEERVEGSEARVKYWQDRSEKDPQSTYCKEHLDNGIIAAEVEKNKPIKDANKQQLLYTKVKSDGKWEFFRGHRLMHKIRSEMRKAPEFEAEQKTPMSSFKSE